MAGFLAALRHPKFGCRRKNRAASARSEKSTLLLWAQSGRLLLGRIDPALQASNL
jgi:hypothetical protein